LRIIVDVAEDLIDHWGSFLLTPDISDPKDKKCDVALVGFKYRVPKDPENHYTFVVRSFHDNEVPPEYALSSKDASSTLKFHKSKRGRK